MLVSDEVRAAPQVVVDELRKLHNSTLPTGAAIHPKVRAPLLIALFLALAAPAPAWAHASLVGVTPPNGSVLARAPAVVRVTFDDTVSVGPGIAAIRNGGGSVLAGRAHVAGSRTLAVPLRRGLGNGDYSVRWSIVSDDGHLESGVVAFAVGLGRPPPLAALAPRATGPTVEGTIARWLVLTGVLGAVGVALLAFVARPRDDERVALVLSAGAVLAAVGCADVVAASGLGTRAGAAHGAAFVAAVLVATGAAAATLDPRALRPALVLALGLAAVPSLAGHALDRGVSPWQVPVDVLHVLAAAAWVGALLGFAVVRDTEPRRVRLLAIGGVALLAPTGIVRAISELTAVSQLWETSYGRMLLVKTGLLLAVLAAGWLVRARLRRRGAVELVLLAGIVVAVAVLVQLRPGRAALTPEQLAAQAALPSPAPPPPPAGAVVLAQRAGTLGVALAWRPAQATVTVLSPSGGGLSGLDVRVDGRPARPCGSGCYFARALAGRRVGVEVSGRRLAFTLPARAVPADALVRRVRHRFRGLRSVEYVERLASGFGTPLVARWRLEPPDRLAYEIEGGAQAVVVGRSRWDRDRAGARWARSAQTLLPQPVPAWTYAANAHVVEQTASTTTVTFADPTIPAWFTLTLDRRTLLPRVLHMVASAHFMTDRYVELNGAPRIRPPR